MNQWRAQPAAGDGPQQWSPGPPQHTSGGWQQSGQLSPHGNSPSQGGRSPYGSQPTAGYQFQVPGGPAAQPWQSSWAAPPPASPAWGSAAHTGWGSTSQGSPATGSSVWSPAPPASTLPMRSTLQSSQGSMWSPQHQQQAHPQSKASAWQQSFGGQSASSSEGRDRSGTALTHSSTMQSLPSEVASVISTRSEPTLDRTIKRRFTQRRLPNEFGNGLAKLRMQRKTVARQPPKVRNANRNGKGLYSQLLHFALYPHLRRAVWFNGVAWLLYICGCWCPTITYWFYLEPLVPEQGSISEGFPYAKESLGPSRVQNSEDYSGMYLSRWVGEACNAKEHLDLIAWLTFLERKTQVTHGDEEKCEDAGGVWCRHWRDSRETTFSTLCHMNDTGAVLRRNCRLTCQLCTPKAGIDAAMAGLDKGHLPQYLEDEMSAWCEFRTAVWDRLYWAKGACLFAVIVLVVISILLYFFRWHPSVVLMCLIIQGLSLLWFGGMFMMLWFSQGAAPRSALERLEEHLRLPVAADPVLTKVHHLFLEFYSKPVHKTVEAYLCMFGIVAQLLGAVNCAAWYLKLLGFLSGRRTLSGFIFGIFCHLLCVLPMRWYWAVMDRVLFGGADKYSARQYGARAEHPGWPNKFLGRRVDRVLGIRLPKLAGRILGDFRSLIAHYCRIYEWDGFMEQNKIVSEAEEDDLKKVGVTCRSVQNLMAWRRSVLICALAYGIFLLPIGVHDVHLVLLRRRGVQEALQWPEEWDEFRAFFEMSHYAIDSQTGTPREATKEDYLNFMLWKLFALVHQLGSGADVWLVLITAFIEWISLACVAFGLVAWLWWTSSKRLTLVAGGLLVYAPIALSLVPRSTYVQQDSWTGIDIFLMRVTGNLFDEGRMDTQLATCWKDIDMGLGIIRPVVHKTEVLCSLFQKITKKKGDKYVIKGLPSFSSYYDQTSARQACDKYLNSLGYLNYNLNYVEANARGACLALQEHVYEDTDSDVEFGQEVLHPSELNSTIIGCGPDVKCYNESLRELFLSQVSSAENSTQSTNVEIRRVLGLYAGVRSAVTTFLELVPASISIVPAVLAAAWRVRLVMPLSRLPTIIIMTLPWIYCPVLWAQFLWFWQLMSSPLLCASLVIVCFGFFQWVVTSHLFRITEPIPPEQLHRAMRKQAYCDWLLFTSGWTMMLLWLLMDDREKSGKLRTQMLEFIGSLACIKLVIRIAFKFLVTRVLAMDFIITQMSNAHFFELGLQAMQRESDAHGKRASYAAEIDDGVYGEAAAEKRKCELMAINDVLELVDARHNTLDALVDIERRMAVEDCLEGEDGGGHKGQQDDLAAIELALQNAPPTAPSQEAEIWHQPAAPAQPVYSMQQVPELQQQTVAAPYAQYGYAGMHQQNQQWGWQNWGWNYGYPQATQNFDALIREFQPTYYPQEYNTYAVRGYPGRYPGYMQ